MDFTQINLSGGTLSLDGNLELLGDLWKGNELSKNLTLSGGSKQVDKNASIAIPRAIARVMVIKVRQILLLILIIR